MSEFMIGQRVIFQGVICVVCKPETSTINKGCAVDVWLDNPERGYKHFADEGNVAPLPNGQL